MRISRRIALFFCLIALTVAFVFPLSQNAPNQEEQLIEHWLRGDPVAFEGTLRIWVADGEATGKGNAAAWLQQRSSAFEKKNFGVFYTMEQMSATVMAQRLAQGERPDIVILGDEQQDGIAPYCTQLTVEVPLLSALSLWQENRLCPLYQTGYGLLINEDALYAEGLNPPAGLDGLDADWVQQVQQALPRAFACDDGDVTSTMAVLQSTLPELVQEAIVTGESGSLSQWKDGHIAVLPCSMRTAWELEKQSILGKQLPAYTWLPLSGFSGHVQWGGVVEQTDTARMDTAAQLLAFYLQKGSQQKLSEIWSVPVRAEDGGVPCEANAQAAFWQAAQQTPRRFLKPEADRQAFVALRDQKDVKGMRNWLDASCID